MSISISNYSVKRSKKERDLNKENPLHNQTPLDTNILIELKRCTLPPELHEYFLDELWDAYEKVHKAQIKKSEKERVDQRLKNAVAELALKESSAKVLWGELYALLDNNDADPQEYCNGQNSKKWRIDYTGEKGNARSITLGSFQNKLSEARKKNPQ